MVDFKVSEFGSRIKGVYVVYEIYDFVIAIRSSIIAETDDHYRIRGD